MKKLEGLIAAPFTPMHPDGSLNPGMVPEYYSLLKRNNVTGAFVNGSTGEGVSLTQKEKMTNLTEWAKCFKSDASIPVINLVGGTSYQECIENAVFSKEQGISAIALLAPYYFKPPSTGHLAEFCARVSEAVPEMPVYFYHIPVLTGCYLPMIDFLEKVDVMIPNFAGIKYTHEDFMDFLSCLNYKNGKYDILWGRDECMLSALVLGAKGSIGSTFNYAAPVYHKLIDAYENGQFVEARRYQQISIDMIRLLGKYGGIATGKAYMRYIGYDLGKFRSPVFNMTEEAYKEFCTDVKGLSMEELFSK